MARKRDYKAEYQRRIANAEKRGLSRSQARGHARPGERGIRPAKARDDDRLDAALKTMRRTGSQSAAAKEHGISSERLRRYVRERGLAERKGRRWHFTDMRPRKMRIISDGEFKVLNLQGFDQASLNSRHSAAAWAFVTKGDVDLLRPFEGRSVIDEAGQSHPLETDPNTLHQLFAVEEPFHQIYKLVQ